MTWKILSVSATDFRSWHSLEWDLTKQPGVTLVVGRKGNSRKSNGSGKSSMFSAILFAGWGWVPKGVPADKVIRKGSDACLVKMTVESSGTRFTIERGRSKRGPSLAVSGFSAEATVSGQQAAIESVIGDLETFLMTRMFTGAMSSFCRLTDSGRKALLERMLRIDRYAAAREIASQELAKTEAVLEASKRQVVSAESNLESARDHRIKALRRSLSHCRKVAEQIATLRENADIAYEESFAAFDSLSQWLRTEVRRKKEAQAAKLAIQQQMEDLEEQIAAAEKATEPLSNRIAQIDARIHEAKRHLGEIQGDRHPDICPTCHQRWPSETDPQQLAKVVSEIETKIVALRREKAPLEKERDEADLAIDALREDLKQRRRKANEVSESVDHRKEQILRSVASDKQVALKMAQRDLQKFLNETDDIPDTDDIAELDAEVEEAKETARTATAAVKECEHRIDALKFWKKGFSSSGIPSYLLDSAVPELNEVAGKIAEDLTDGELTVAFNAASTKGSGTVFQVEASYADGGDSFECASRGEQTRVDLAVLLAIADLSASRTSTACEQLFFDEVMDGADEHFAESFVGMLRRHYKGRQCWIISHDPGIGAVCDRVMKVLKKGGVSHLEAA